MLGLAQLLLTFCLLHHHGISALPLSGGEALVRRGLGASSSLRSHNPILRKRMEGIFSGGAKLAAHPAQETNSVLRADETSNSFLHGMQDLKAERNPNEGDVESMIQKNRGALHDASTKVHKYLDEVGRGGQENPKKEKRLADSYERAILQYIADIDAQLGRIQEKSLRMKEQQGVILTDPTEGVVETHLLEIKKGLVEARQDILNMYQRAEKSESRFIRSVKSAWKSMKRGLATVWNRLVRKQKA